MQITSKERVKMSLSWQEPDRVPIQIYTTPEIYQKLTEYFGGRNILTLARIKTMDDFKNYPWPSVDDYDFSTIEEQCEQYKDFAVCFGDA